MASGAESRPTRSAKLINKPTKTSENDPNSSENIVFKENFNKKLTEFYESQCGSIKKPWYKQRVLEVIKQIKSGKVAMNAGVRRTPGEYYWISKYDIMQIDGQEGLIFKKSSPDDPVIQIVASEDYFDLLFKIHKECGHGGRDKMRFCTKDKYYINRKAIEIFVSMCPTCDHKRSLPKKGLKPIVSKDFNVRGQVDLADFSSTPDNEYKWLLKYQDHATKFLHLRPLRTDQASEVALELLYIFLEFGAPCILQSDNGRKFTTNVLKEVVKLWPECQIVIETPQDSHTKGIIEKNNQNVESLLRNWMRDNNTTNWSLGCRFVQYEKNLSYHRVISGTPYRSVFGCDPYGSQNSNAPNELLKPINRDVDIVNSRSISWDNIPDATDISIEIELIDTDNNESAANDSVRDSDDSDIDNQTAQKNSNTQDIEIDIENNDISSKTIQVTEGTSDVLENVTNSSCPVCGLGTNGAYVCQTCSKHIHATCGSSNGNEGSIIQCFMCTNKLNIKKERNETQQGTKRATEIEETAKKHPRLDIEEEPETSDSSDVWTYFERETGRTARCALCLVTLPRDTAILKTHLQEKHQKKEDDTEDDHCYTEVVYLENDEQTPIKTELKRKSLTVQHPPEPKKPRVETDESHNEEVETFGKYVTSLLKKLPKELCAQLQMDIVNLIMTAKLKSMARPAASSESTPYNAKDPL